MIVPQASYVEASVTPNIVSVAFSYGSTKIGTGTQNNGFVVNWKLSVPGTYTVQAVGKDNAGNLYYAPSVTFTAVADVPPSVSMTFPTSGSSYIGPTNIPLECTATSSDGSIASVAYYNGATKLGGANFTWKNVPPGTYSLTAVATDNYGVSATSAPVTLTITPDVPPTVSIGYPADGSSFASGTTIPVWSSATSTDAAIDNVTYYNGATKLKTVSASPYSYNWPKLAAGTYTLTAVATDNYGVSTTSAPVTITVTP